MKKLFGKPIEQIVILLAAEDGTVASYIKDKKEYMPNVRNGDTRLL
jgi:hypothetical protein